MKPNSGKSYKITKAKYQVTTEVEEEAGYQGTLVGSVMVDNTNH